MAFYRQVGSVPPKRHTQHRDPDGQALPRGADGRGGVLLGLLAALPPGRAVGDRRQRGLGAARPDPDAEPPAQAAAPQAARARDRPCFGHGRGHRPPAGAGQQRRPDRVRRDRGRPVAVLPQRDRRRVRLRRGRLRHRRDRARGAELPHRRLRHRAARDHAPLGAGRAEPALRDRGEQPRRAAEALPVALRAAPRARAVLRARPARTDRAVPGRGRGRRGAGQAPHQRRDRRHPDDLRDAPVRRGRLGRLPLPLHLQHRRLHADHRQDPPAAAGAPGLRGPQLRGLQLPAAQGRLPRARDPGALLPLQRRQRRGHVLRRRRLRGAQGLGHRARLDLAAPRRLRARPAAVGDRGVARGRLLRGVRGHGRHLRPARPRRGRAGGRGPGVRLDLGRPRPRRCDNPAVFSNS